MQLSRSECFGPPELYERRGGCSATRVMVKRAYPAYRTRLPRGAVNRRIAHAFNGKRLLILTACQHGPGVSSPYAAKSRASRLATHAA